MRKLLTYSGFLCLFAVLAACEKEERISGEPSAPISPVPEIWLGNMPLQYSQFDDVTIPVNYRDGDGDIGFANADSAVVFVTDNRADLLITFHVPPLAPPDANVAITGKLEVVVENIILLNTSGNPETTTFSVRLRDRAGNWSNEVVTPQLTIQP